jgi:formamidopyrimidine-DNA glycosylase
MPELPEIVLRAREVERELRGRTILSAQLMQPKCLNLPAEEFAAQLQGERFGAATHRGKWIVANLERHHLLINLGMGGDLLLHEPDEALPEKKLQAVWELEGGARLSFRFWWFGNIHLVPRGELATHPQVGKIGPDPLAADFTVERLAALLGKRKSVKTILLDQTQIGGVGNMYAHDILFRARLHPERKANTLSPAEVSGLWQALRDELRMALDLGGSRWELGLRGQGGQFDTTHFLVGYREGKPCPTCGTAVAKIKTGSTAGFICPECQPL